MRNLIFARRIGKGRDVERAKKTTFIDLNDEDSDDNDVGRNISTERRNKVIRSVEKDEGKNEAARRKRRKLNWKQ